MRDGNGCDRRQRRWKSRDWKGALICGVGGIGQRLTCSTVHKVSDCREKKSGVLRALFQNVRSLGVRYFRNICSSIHTSWVYSELCPLFFCSNFHFWSTFLPWPVLHRQQNILLMHSQQEGLDLNRHRDKLSKVFLREMDER